MLKLLDIVTIKKENLNKYKLHLAIGVKNKKEPLYELSKDIEHFKSWQEWQNKKNFNRDFILSLIYYASDEWIFGGIYKVKDVNEIFMSANGGKHKLKYNTELIETYKDLIGRLIINFRRPGRQSYLYLEKWVNRLKIVEILKEPYTIDPFPGYENIIIDFYLLKAIIDKEELSWKTALSSVKGIYIITDKNNGKNYVGAAYGENSFWSRWSIYAKNGHGGNKKLEKVIDENGLEYVSNFQFSILEVRSKITDDEEIIKREAHWKNILKSREFGYNEN